MPPVSEIKLIRTDTTLDLSQKAEKVWFDVVRWEDVVQEHSSMGLCDRSGLSLKNWVIVLIALTFM